MSNRDSRQNYQYAPLTSAQLEKLRDVEKSLNMEADQEIVLLAYNKEHSKNQ